MPSLFVANDPSDYTTNLMDSLFNATYINPDLECFVICFISPFIVFIFSFLEFSFVTCDNIFTSAMISGLIYVISPKL